jgi:hypothetical protein
MWSTEDQPRGHKLILMGVTPGGLGGCNPPEFEVGVANVLQPPEFHEIYYV